MEQIHYNTTNNGAEGNRTPVRKPIPCSSTIISCSFTFPPPYENKHPYGFSSFMLRPYTQSLIYVVSHKIDARFLMCECIKADSSIKLRMLNYLQRLILILPFNAPHADSFTSFMTPVETSTTPYWITATHSVVFIVTSLNVFVNYLRNIKTLEIFPKFKESSESILPELLWFPSGFR